MGALHYGWCRIVHGRNRHHPGRHRQGTSSPFRVPHWSLCLLVGVVVVGFVVCVLVVLTGAAASADRTRCLGYI